MLSLHVVDQDEEAVVLESFHRFLQLLLPVDRAMLFHPVFGAIVVQDPFRIGRLDQSTKDPFALRG